MSKKSNLIPKPVKLVFSYIFVVLMIVVCLVAATNTLLRIYRYHDVRSGGISTYAYLADNGNGRGIPYTGGGRNHFNCSLHYFFQNGEGERIYSTDQVAHRYYSRDSQVGQSLEVRYDPKNPKHNYLDRSVYGDYESILQVICYLGVVVMFTMVLVLNVQVLSGRAPREMSKYISYTLLAVIVLSYIGAKI